MQSVHIWINSSLSPPPKKSWIRLWIGNVSERIHNGYAPSFGLEAARTTMAQWLSLFVTETTKRWGNFRLKTYLNVLMKGKWIVLGGHHFRAEMLLTSYTWHLHVTMIKALCSNPNLFSSPVDHRPHDHPHNFSSWTGLKNFQSEWIEKYTKKPCATKLAVWFKAFKEVFFVFFVIFTASSSIQQRPQKVINLPQQKTCCRCLWQLRFEVRTLSNNTFVRL